MPASMCLMAVEVGRPGLSKNPKFLRFCAIMSETDKLVPAYCRGLLETLWDVAYEEGNPVIGDELNVKVASGYPGSAKVITNALLRAGDPEKKGFIEELPGRPGVYQIHELVENAPEYVKRRQRRTAERKDSARIGPKKNVPEVDMLRKLWNTYASVVGLPVCKDFSLKSQAARDRVSTARKRLEEHPNLKEWETVIARIVARPFCLGKNDSGWKATFEYLCRVKTFDAHFDGKFCSVTPFDLVGYASYVADGGMDADHVIARLKTLGDKLVKIAKATPDKEMIPVKASLMHFAKVIKGLRGDGARSIESDLDQLEGELFEEIAVNLPDADKLEAVWKAEGKETGIAWKAIRDRRLRKQFDLPHLTLE